MAKMDSQDLLAHHEAAHAVVAIALGWEVGEVTIVENDDYFGSCKVIDFECYFDGNRWSGEVKASARQAILYDLAGIAAELHVNGECGDGCEGDWDAAYIKAKYLNRSGDPQAYLDYALGRTRSMVNKLWRAIAAVANELLEHKALVGEDIYKITRMKP